MWGRAAAASRAAPLSASRSCRGGADGPPAPPPPPLDSMGAAHALWPRLQQRLRGPQPLAGRHLAPPHRLRVPEPPHNALQGLGSQPRMERRAEVPQQRQHWQLTRLNQALPRHGAGDLGHAPSAQRPLPRGGGGEAGSGVKGHRPAAQQSIHVLPRLPDVQTANDGTQREQRWGQRALWGDAALWGRGAAAAEAMSAWALMEAGAVLGQLVGVEGGEGPREGIP